jgi:hypothetical protein
MNRSKQFWALVRFQTLVNPFLWIFLLAFTLPLFIEFNKSPDYHPSLGMLLTDYNQIMIIIMGSMVLMPEAFHFAATPASALSGTELLLTRAVDRPLVFRARAAFYAFLILLVPTLLTLAALPNPDVQVGEYNRTLHEAILARLPGSASTPVGPHDALNPILIPGGNVLVHAWHIGTYLMLLLLTQAVVFVVQPLSGRLRRWLFWTLVFAVGMLPIFEPLATLASTMHEKLPYNELFFFWYVTHQVEFWGLLVLSAIALQWWCERRFARMEF